MIKKNHWTVAMKRERDNARQAFSNLNKDTMRIIQSRFDKAASYPSDDSPSGQMYDLGYITACKEVQKRFEEAQSRAWETFEGIES